MPAKPPAPQPPSPTGRGPRIATRPSGVHGKGVFALRDLAAGETVLEYKGEVISWKEALRRHPHDPAQPNHTFYFHIDDKRVIDGGVRGNAARWINHACHPNCEADERNGRIFIQTLRPVPAGQELSYDYGLIIDAPYTPELLAEFPCWCGADNCRGTLLSPPDDSNPWTHKDKKGKKKSKKKAKKSEKKNSKDNKKDAKKGAQRG